MNSSVKLYKNVCKSVHWLELGRLPNEEGVGFAVMKTSVEIPRTHKKLGIAVHICDIILGGDGNRHMSWGLWPHSLLKVASSSLREEAYLKQEKKKCEVIEDEIPT